MKRTAFFMTLMLGLTGGIMGQFPLSFNYQAVVRDSFGDPMPQQQVMFRITIQHAAPSDAVVYQEEHLVGTDDFGVASFLIGTGQPLTGSFTLIDWAAAHYLLAVEFDPEGTGNYLSMGTSPFSYVPYAMFALRSPFLHDNTLEGTGQLGNLYRIAQQGAQAGQVLQWTGSSWQPVWAQGDSINDLLDARSDAKSIFLGVGSGELDDGDNYNLGLGPQSLSSNLAGNHNLGLGAFSLNHNYIGVKNIAIGPYALFTNTTGSNNISIGYEASHDNLTGDDNVAIGVMSLYTADGTINNTAVGNYTLYNNQVGAGNIAVGLQALELGTVPWHNVGIGIEALRNCNGNNNIGIGYQALWETNEANGNTAVGCIAGWHNETGGYNSYFGYGAGTSLPGIGNATAIGHDAVVTAPDQMRFGNTDISSIGGWVDWTSLSDKRVKTALREDVSGLNFVMRLRPLTYSMDMDAVDRFTGRPAVLDESGRQGRLAKAEYRFCGFLAQEVEEAAQACGFSFSGVDKPGSVNDLYGLRYATFVVPLVKAVQEQQSLIRAQQLSIEELTRRVRELENR